MKMMRGVSRGYPPLDALGSPVGGGGDRPRNGDRELPDPPFSGSGPGAVLLPPRTPESETGKVYRQWEALARAIYAHAK